MTAIFDAFPRQSSDGKGALLGYAVALDGVGDAAKRYVFVRILRGKQKGFDGSFCPTPAQLSQWCREEQDNLDRLERERREPELVPYPIGGKPPAGYVALSEYAERRAQRDQRRLSGPTDGDAA